MSRGIADIAGVEGADGSDVLSLKVMNTAYTEAGSVPVTHLFGRDADGEYHHIEVEGHRPSFYIRESEYDARVENHYAVHHTEMVDDDGTEYTNLHGEPLVRIYTHLPGQVPEMRELFEKHYEADIFYNKRFLIDEEIYTGVRIDTSDADVGKNWLRGDMRVDVDALEPLDIEETPSVEPRTAIIDIEVAGKETEGVPDTNKAEYPISTIVAYDSYDDAYTHWLLESDEHTNEQLMDIAESDGDYRIFTDESEMLADFHAWVETRRPDIVTGWYSNDFDIPYLINRSRNENSWAFKDWSPLGEVYESRYDPVIKGVSTVDMLDGYKKTQIHKLTSKKLDDIAEKELDEAKVDIELSHTEMWKQQPKEFLRYNKRDVELVKRINEEATSEGVIGLLDNLRAVTGVSYTDPIGGNIDMMDTLFLRKASERSMALPSAEKPEVGDYHGAYVFTPWAGLHEHIVYPDYSSLYPNIMYQCNISPETLIGTADDLAASPYDEDDAVWTYIDTETPPSMKKDVEADDDKMEKLYFIKPSKEEGFIRSVLDDIMGLADQYSGGLYEAVKRVRNSSYGVLGDSDSYGKGFRLFDWRLAEGTTLGGQKMLKAGAKMFEEAVEDPDAKVIYGDTDSVVTTIPHASNGEEALDMAMDAAERIEDDINEHAVEIFGLESIDEARMDLEIESYASAIFFKGQDNGHSEDGVKKRYVQRVEWDDDDLWADDPELTIKGFEYVRSDVAAITKDVQYETFEALMTMEKEEARKHVTEYIEKKIEGVMDGSVPKDEWGVPFGISQRLDKYGVDGRGMPWYHGAKYANEFVYESEAITPGDKPLYYYVRKGRTGEGRPNTFRAEDAAKGDQVDCISVLDADDVPTDMVLDRRKMVQKTILDPMEAIFHTLGWDFDSLVRAADKAVRPEEIRDESQQGFEAFEAM